jgi:hypothetical protein
MASSSSSSTGTRRSASDRVAGAGDHLPSRPQARTRACAKSEPLDHPAPYMEARCDRADHQALARPQAHPAAQDPARLADHHGCQRRDPRTQAHPGPRRSRSGRAPADALTHRAWPHLYPAAAQPGAAWKDVDWERFDIVGVDHYRDADRGPLCQHAASGSGHRQASRDHRGRPRHGPNREQRRAYRFRNERKRRLPVCSCITRSRWPANSSGRGCGARRQTVTRHGRRSNSPGH